MTHLPLVLLPTILPTSDMGEHVAIKNLLIWGVSWALITSSGLGLEKTRLFWLTVEAWSDQDRAELAHQSVEIIDYAGDQKYIVRAPESKEAWLRAQNFVKQLTLFQTQVQFSSRLKNLFDRLGDTPRWFDLILPARSDRPMVIEMLQSFGARVNPSAYGGSVIEAQINDEQAKLLLSSGKILWIEPATSIEFDDHRVTKAIGIDDLREVVAAPGLTGVGIRGHLLEGIDPNHPAFGSNPFRNAPIGVFESKPSSHGQSAFGIIFANPNGILPHAQGYYTHQNAVLFGASNPDGITNRFALTERLIQNHHIQFQSASWGHERTREYTARSLELDQLIYELDIPIIQSQSNGGDTLSRPEAWAKNVISVGAVYHHGNTEPNDDTWSQGSSVGPAADGRIKPDVVGYFDGIETTSLNNGYLIFGGTSAATPMIAGCVGLILEMWNNFKLHASTVKALLIHSARPYSFNSPQDDLARNHQGWGLPDLVRVFNSESLNVLIRNEDDILGPNQYKEFEIEVSKNDEFLRATLVYTDPPGSLFAHQTRVNDLTLRVTSPDGSIYFGNCGLNLGNISKIGCASDKINTVENVFIENPQHGTWIIRIQADEINADGHKETGEWDADFALVVSHSN